MKKRTNKKQKKLLIGICAVLFVIGVGAGLYFGLSTKQDENVEKKTEKTVEVSGEMKDGELVDYEQRGDVTMPDYKGLTVTVTPTETDVYTQILLDAEDAVDKVKVQNANRVLSGDWVSLDYVGYIDGQESEDLAESAAVIKVGRQDLFNAAFDRALIGQKIGTDISFDITFPEDHYDVDVAGMTVTFSVTLNAKVNDDYVKVMTKNKYKTLDSYYRYVKKKELAENIDIAGDTAWDEYIEKCEVENYPEGSVKQAFADLKRQYKGFGELNGTTYEEVIYELGMTEEDVKNLAKDEVKARMVAKSIAKKENLVLTDEKYEQYLLSELEPEEDKDKTLAAMEKNYKETTGVYPHDDMLIRLVKEYIGKYTKQE